MSVEKLKQLQEEKRRLNQELYNFSDERQIKEKQDKIIAIVSDFHQHSPNSFPIKLPTFQIDHFIDQNEKKYSAHYCSFFSKTWYLLNASVFCSFILVLGLSIYAFIYAINGMKGTTLLAMAIVVSVLMTFGLLMMGIAITIESKNDLLARNSHICNIENLDQLHRELNTFLFEQCMKEEQEIKIKKYELSQLESPQINFCESCGARLSSVNCNACDKDKINSEINNLFQDCKRKEKNKSQIFHAPCEIHINDKIYECDVSASIDIDIEFINKHASDLRKCVERLVQLGNTKINMDELIQKYKITQAGNFDWYGDEEYEEFDELDDREKRTTMIIDLHYKKVPYCAFLLNCSRRDTVVLPHCIAGRLKRYMSETDTWNYSDLIKVVATRLKEFSDAVGIDWNVTTDKKDELDNNISILSFNLDDCSFDIRHIPDKNESSIEYYYHIKSE